MKQKRCKSWLLLGAALLWMGTMGCAASEDETMNEINQEADLVSVAELSEAMGAGWNLGNQLEAAMDGMPEETLWGNPEVTQELITAVADAGFGTIRIPVSYLGKIDDSNGYQVDAAWLDRIETVVQYCYNAGLYVILNVHGDGYHTIAGSWLLVDAANQKAICAKYEAVWQQLAERFAAYDGHLIFESMNEVFDGTYQEPNSAFYENLNRYNQIFVDTVRATGGENAQRYLLVPGWNTAVQYTVGSYGFRLPEDRACTAGENRLLVSVHYYDPWDYCDAQNHQICLWGAKGEAMVYGFGFPEAAKATWGNEAYLDAQFQQLYDTFVSKGIPVVIGEYGAPDKTETNPAYSTAILANRVYYDGYVAGKAAALGMIPICWDNGYNGMGGFGLFDRTTCTQTQPEVITAICRAVQEKNPAAGADTIPEVVPNSVQSEAIVQDSVQKQ